MRLIKQARRGRRVIDSSRIRTTPFLIGFSPPRCDRLIWAVSHDTHLFANSKFPLHTGSIVLHVSVEPFSFNAMDHTRLIGEKNPNLFVPGRFILPSHWVGNDCNCPSLEYHIAYSRHPQLPSYHCLRNKHVQQPEMAMST